MNDKQIADKLRLFLETEFPNQGVTLAGDTRLLEDWFVDSMGIIETVMFIEREFGTEIARADINGENFKDVNSLVRLISMRLAS